MRQHIPVVKERVYLAIGKTSVYGLVVLISLYHHVRYSVEPVLDVACVGGEHQRSHFFVADKVSVWLSRIVFYGKWHDIKSISCIIPLQFIRGAFPIVHLFEIGR